MSSGMVDQLVHGGCDVSPKSMSDCDFQSEAAWTVESDDRRVYVCNLASQSGVVMEMRNSPP